MNAKRIPGATHPRVASHLSVVLAACLLLLAASVVLAQSGGGYDLSWSTVDGGGGTFSTGGLSCGVPLLRCAACACATGAGGQAQGVYTLGGTAGQPDAGLLSGGSYTLGGGFWGGGAAAPTPEHTLYLPLALRQSP